MSNKIEDWRRRERDYPIVTGRALYTNDINLPNMLYCTILGSSYAHARIKSINVSKALEIPGVINVITGAELIDKINPLPTNSDYSKLGWHWRIPKVYPLAIDKVRFVGEPIAAIVATNSYIAEDALEMIDVEYEPLPVVVNPEKAMSKDAPLLYEEWGDNIQAYIKFIHGDIEKSFSKADKVLRVQLKEQRYSGFPIEPRCCVADYDERRNELRVWLPNQTPYQSRRYIANVLNMLESHVKVIVPNVGGGFGNRIIPYKEVIPCILSLILKKPIKWFENRRENFLSQTHQRDLKWDVEAAFKNDGKMLSIRGKFIMDYGVEGTNRDAGAPAIVPAVRSIPSAYKLEAIQIDAYGVVTNKAPYGAYRGYGKDKGNRLIERVLNIAAREFNLSPEEIRFKNFIQPNEFPYRQITGYLYDSGNYPQVLKRALQLLNIEYWREQQKLLRERNKHIGIGLAFMVEPAGASIPYSIFTGIESAKVSLFTDGSIHVYSNTIDIGQHSKVAIVSVVAENLGVKPDDIKVIMGDSDIVGLGPWSSRGVIYGISAVVKAAKALKLKILKVAAKILNEHFENLHIKDGIIYSKSNLEKQISIRDLANRVYFFPGPQMTLTQDMLEKGEITLEAIASWFSPTTIKELSSVYTTFCCGADAAVVEVDLETGKVKVLKYVAVHDVGKIIDPASVEAQVQGGIAQGIGGALFEELIYNEDGQLLTTTFTDYLMPTAIDIPEIEIDHIETPSPVTETGAKGMGEGPIIIPPEVIISAVEDALAPFKVRISETPLKPERIWRLLKSVT